MANKNLWAAAPTSRGAVLGTELNSLANGGTSALGTAYDNTANLNKIGFVDVVLASLAVAAASTITLFMAVSLDGTNYEDAPSATNPGFSMQADAASVNNSTSAKRVRLGPFPIPPGKMKFALRNNCGVALASSGNTATLYTIDETNNG